MEVDQNKTKDVPYTLSWESEIFGRRYLTVNQRALERSQQADSGINFDSSGKWWKVVKGKLTDSLTSLKRIAP